MIPALGAFSLGKEFGKEVLLQWGPKEEREVWQIVKAIERSKYQIFSYLSIMFSLFQLHAYVNRILFICFSQNKKITPDCRKRNENTVDFFYVRY